MNRSARCLSWTWLLAGLGLLLGSSSPLFAEATYAYSTYLGGTWRDSGEAIATDPSGNVYIALLTDSDDFLGLTEPPLEPPQYRPFDYRYVMVVGLDAMGRLLYSTRTFGVYSGRAIEIGGIAAAPDGSVVVAGTMFMEDPQYYAFYARLSPSGQIVTSGLMGGTRTEAHDVAVDAHGHFYISGTTWGDGYHGNPLTQGSAALVFGVGFQGGGPFSRIDTPGNDHGTHIEVAPDGSVIMAGITDASNYTGLDGDGFLVWLDSRGAVVRSMTFGGGGDEKLFATALLPDSSVVVAGTSSSVDFPTRHPTRPGPNGMSEPFLIRVSSSGEFLASTLGGISPLPRDLAAGSDGALYVLGSDAYCGSALIARLDPEDFTVLDTDCIADAYGTSLAVDPVGWLSVTGTAWEGFNLLNPVQGFYAGNYDAFAVRMLMNRPPECSGATAHPAVVWPPNGKLVPVSILGVTDPDGDPITLTVTGIRQDEPRAGQSMDASGIGTAHPSIRAQRAGEGDGRVYHIAFEALDDQGAACTGEVTVCVPHDASGSDCGDGGALVDSMSR